MVPPALAELRPLTASPLVPWPSCASSEMHLHGGDVWLHAAPLFHLVDVFAVYGITLVGGRHVVLGSFSPREAIAAIGG